MHSGSADAIASFEARFRSAAMELKLVASATSARIGDLFLSGINTVIGILLSVYIYACISLLGAYLFIIKLYVFLTVNIIMNPRFPISILFRKEGIKKL